MPLPRRFARRLTSSTPRGMESRVGRKARKGASTKRAPGKRMSIAKRKHVGLSASAGKRATDKLRRRPVGVRVLRE